MPELEELLDEELEEPVLPDEEDELELAAPEDDEDEDELDEDVVSGGSSDPKQPVNTAVVAAIKHTRTARARNPCNHDSVIFYTPLML